MFLGICVTFLHNRSFTFICLHSLQVLVFSLQCFCHFEATTTVQLTSNGQKFVLVGSILNITCVASNTTFMAWSSDEYIGRTQQLEFNFRNLPGDISPPGKVPTTFATFVWASGPFNGLYNLESQLQLEVLANYTQFTVLCHNPGQGSQKNITFFLVGKRLHYQGLSTLLMYFATYFTRRHAH